MAALLLWAPPTFAETGRDEPEDDLAVDAAPAPGYIDGTNVSSRTAAFLAFCASTKPRREDYPKEAMAHYVARLLLDRDAAYARQKIVLATSVTLKRARDRLARDPKDANAIDPFDQHALVNGYAICPDRFPTGAVANIRSFMALYAYGTWHGFGSLNYRLMRDGSGYLAAELWPDFRDAAGLDAAGIRVATSKRLFESFETMTHRNLDEYNAPIYFATDLMPVRMLAEFARDPEMKKRATLTLDWMMVNMAGSWNRGYYVSTAGRSKYWGSSISSPDGPGATALAGWFYFGGLRPVAAGSGAFHAFWMAYPGAYRVPDVVTDVALDRAKPFAQRESVLSIPRVDVRKYTWHSTSYSLASQWEQTSGPTAALYKETKRQMLKWVSDKPVSTFAVQQENPQRPYKRGETITNAFGYGENPYAQILQHEGSMIGVYDVPAPFLFHRFYAPFTKSGAILQREESGGWIFCHGGSMLFAFKSIKPVEWGKPRENCDVLWCNARRNGWILETCEAAPYAGGGTLKELARFANDVMRKTKIDAAAVDAAIPRLIYTSLTGHTLDLTFTPFGQPYHNQRRIDGVPVDYRAFPLIENPWVRQMAGQPVLTVQHGDVRRLYDFAGWTVSETGR